MEIRLTYNGTVNDNGKLTIHRKKELISEVATVYPGKKVKITIERYRKNRSVFQNSYYWGVVIPICQAGLIDIGYKVGKEETHEYLKSQFLKIEIVNENTGEYLNTINSTTKLTTSQMMDYFAEISQWAVEFLNVQIPEPGEQIDLEL